MTFAAGLACEGLRPFCVIYSTFLQRGYDQIIHDVALQDLPGAHRSPAVYSGPQTWKLNCIAVIWWQPRYTVR